jgi:2-polyprenyl-3-methyl-5-hydroxy-6-metoxy-1,4-benzoquinol methylase
MEEPLRQEVVACAVCGATAHRTLFVHDGFHVVRCHDCSFCYTRNPVHPDDLPRLYQASYFSPESTIQGERVRGGDARSRRRNQVLARALRRMLDEHGGAKQARPSLLEIGCGTGYFLDEARRQGFDVEGVDISAEASRYAREAFAIEVHAGQLTDADLRFARSFDVVAMWHVLEHVPHVGPFLARAHAALAPGGLLAVEVPNYHSLKWHLGRDKFAGGLHPKFHRYIFSHRTLARLLARHGFVVVRDGGQSLEEFLPDLTQWRNRRALTHDVCRFLAAPLLSALKTEMVIRTIARKRAG